jgi:hypothetical protein
MLEAGAAYSPVTAFGANLLVYLNADSITGVDGDAISAMTNQGTAASFAQGASTVRPILKIIGGNKIIRHDGSRSLLSNTYIAAMATWTFYTVARPTTTSTGGYFVAAGNAANSIVSGYVSGKWEYVETPRTSIANINTVNFQIVSNTVGTADNTNYWSIGRENSTGVNFWTGDWKIIIAINRAITTAEATDIEAWLATYL